MQKDSTSNDWINEIGATRPLVIAGPCSAETERQVIETALALRDSPATIFRAGIWKPRTRPGGFEGIGSIGLKWLQRAKAETGLMMAVEVANPVHVKLALEHDIDVLWIGARTTVNPFTVQEIAEALENTDKIVLVKNPVNPDLGLWLGGIERLHNAGVRKLGAVHRGFSTYEKSLYRNIPEWQIPIELQNRLPGLPLLCDPSHIGGRRDLIAQISQQALDLNYDGLMIETHPDPDNAWSDAAQQVTPEALKTILGALQIRERTTESPDFHQQLAKLRAHIDIEDSKLLDILSHRMKIAEAIGALKRENNVAVLQIPRWQEILEKMTRDGLQKGLSEEFILRLIKAVHQESILHQERVINK